MILPHAADRWPRPIRCEQPWSRQGTTYRHAPRGPLHLRTRPTALTSLSPVRPNSPQPHTKVAAMQQHAFGKFPPVSILTLGGGGLGMLWGQTTFEECVATVHEAVAAAINLLDLAPRYGDGKAEEVVGQAFGGHLPAGVRVTSKC